MLTPSAPTHARRNARLGVAIFLLFAATSLQTTAQSSVPYGTTADDLPHRDPDIHWPAAFNPATAKIFSHNELFLHADCHRAFTRLADLTSWPTWFLLTKDVHILGPDKTVKEGTTAHLLIFGSPISTRITEFVPDSRISWAPKGDTEAQPGHYHTWRFLPRPAGCLVETEESGITAQDAASAKAGDTMMHRAHDLWLASLRWTAEQSVGQ